MSALEIVRISGLHSLRAHRGIVIVEVYQRRIPHSRPCPPNSVLPYRTLNAGERGGAPSCTEAIDKSNVVLETGDDLELTRPRRAYSPSFSSKTLPTDPLEYTPGV